MSAADPKIVTESGATFLCFGDHTVIIRPRLAGPAGAMTAGCVVTVVTEDRNIPDQVMASALYTDGDKHSWVTTSVQNDPGWHSDVAQHTLRGRTG
jgi:hypothetical protein